MDAEIIALAEKLYEQISFQSPVRFGDFSVSLDLVVKIHEGNVASVVAERKDLRVRRHIKAEMGSR